MAVFLATSLSLAGCMAEARGELQPQPSSELTTSTTVEETTTTIEAKTPAQDYFASTDRNNHIAAEVQAAGEKIINAMYARKLGAYNFTYASSGQTDGPGWGTLEHDTEDNQPYDFNLFVYYNEQGRIDPSKGVQSIGCQLDGKPIVGFESPGKLPLISPYYQPATGWEVNAPVGSATYSAQYYAEWGDVTDVKTIDDGALQWLHACLQQEGIE